MTLVWGLINAFLFPLYLSYLQPLTSFLLYLFVFLAGGRAIYTVFHRRQKEENTVSTSQKNKQALEETEQAKGGDVSKKINDIFPVKDPVVRDGEECLIGRDMETSGDAIDACPVRPESNTSTDIAEQAGGEGVLCLPPKKQFPSLPLTTMEDRRKELASLLESDVTVDELVTLYLRCRRENNLLVSAEYLQAAF
ncbi:MAG: hypothetical protein GX887_01895, partial [Firmicutes bacterium]|nr:hypothetical protein [Bacillota bacterium]